MSSNHSQYNFADGFYVILMHSDWSKDFIAELTATYHHQSHFAYRSRIRRAIREKRSAAAKRSAK